MQTLKNEKTITTFANCITLTTHRIRHEVKISGRHEVTGIMLDEVASCSMAHRSIPLLLVLAGLLYIGGIVGFTETDKVGWVVGGMVLGTFLVFVYFASRRQTLAIASAGATIRVTIVGNHVADAIKFIDAIEDAKNAHLFRLPPHTPTVT